MNEIKYTTDGRKVVVLGNLNSKEIIVQEIFIVNGEEIPQGENFIVKSLLDSPGVSWKEKKVKEWDAFYDRLDKEHTKRINEINKAMIVLQEKLNTIKATASQISPEAFEMVEKVLTDKIKWGLKIGYSFELANFSVEKELADFWDGRFDGFKLLTLFGNGKGSFTWNINQYRDGSGSNRTVLFFETKEEAIAAAREELDAKKEYNDYDVKFMKEWGIVPEKVKYKTYRDRVLKLRRDYVDKATKDLEAATNSLEEMSKEVSHE
jgi:hypothetical protein